MFLKIKANIILHPVVISATILRNITKDSVRPKGTEV